jgi:hypothetical protein
MPLSFDNGRKKLNYGGIEDIQHFSGRKLMMYDVVICSAHKELIDK